MRKLAILTMMLALTACGGHVKVSQQDAIDKIRSLPHLSVDSDEEAKDLIYEVCRQFNEGWGEAIIEHDQFRGYPPDEARQAIDVSVSTACPEFQGDVDNYEKHNPLPARTG